VSRDDEAGLLAEHNLVESLWVWAASAEGGACASVDGAHLAWCATPLRSFNNIVPVAGDGLPAAMERTAAFDPHGRYRVRVRESVGVEDGDAERLGLVRRGGIPSLVLDDLALMRASAGVREVRDAGALADMIEVVGAGFDWAPEDLARVFTERMFSDERWCGFVLYDGDAPVATAQIVVDENGTGGVYYVATRQAWRGRGHGAAVTSHAIAAARERGCVRSSLQASPMGLPIYERMGFRQVAYYVQYVPQESKV
jgi:GNAT superfamily N-acetyltransferase